MGIKGKTPSSGLDDKEVKSLIGKLMALRRKKEKFNKGKDSVVPLVTQEERLQKATALMEKFSSTLGMDMPPPPVILPATVPRIEIEEKNKTDEGSPDSTPANTSIRFTLSSPDAISRFREDAEILLRVYGEINEKLIIILIAKAQELGVHKLDFNKQLWKIFAKNGLIYKETTNTALDSMFLPDIIKDAERGIAGVEQSLQEAAGEFELFFFELVEQDLSEEAAKWFTKAAEQGNPTAQYRVGLCYEKGVGVTQNHDIAFMWYKRAARTYYGQGYAYEVGLFVEKDIASAAKWYQKAAELGHADAQYLLGRYKEENSVLKNEKDAVKWYRMAAEQGHALAQARLGFCYKHGIGIDKNDTEAIKWLKLSAEQGNDSAQRLLKSFNQDEALSLIIS